MKLSQLPVVSFITRYWYVLLLLWGSFLLWKSPAAFAVLDVLTYIPIAFMVSVTLALLFRHFFNWNSTDRDIRTGESRMAYRAMSPADRVWVVQVQWLGYLIAAAIITSTIVSKLISP